MSVTGTFADFKLHKHSVGTAFEYPLGTYVLEGVAVGDASAGVVRFDIDYNPGYIYSLEAVSATKQDTTGTDVVVTWQPQIDPGGSGFVVLYDTTLALTRSVALGRDTFRRLPLSVQYPNLAPVRCQVEFDVNTNTVVYRVAIWGYYWDFRCTRTLTGPFRPI